MPTIIIDDKPVECREDDNVLQAALNAGWDIPHYCYHPSLKVVASCRLCLMEMKMPHPKTKELVWSPKLVPSCQTPVRDGMEVRFDTERVKQNQETCMEAFLLNHPLDCPVCDQAGECYLQDYSFKFGKAESRMVDPKLVNPKKDIGPHTYLYQDRCVMCSRCVRFTEEISGTRELCIVNRGSRNEIDIFPGRPLDNPIQGNVVDICPVGSLLDKDFLFKQRVWLLKSVKSVCPGCSTGCSIWIDHNENVVWRLKPRFNPEVNDHWMCDAGRYGWKYMQQADRLKRPVLRRGGNTNTPQRSALPELLRYRFQEFVEEHSGAEVGVMLSPMMSCEEAWLLVRFMREVAPGCAIALGPIPVEGEETTFPVGAGGHNVKFTIKPEKCPNRRGVGMVIDAAGGTKLTYEEFVGKIGDAIKAGWVVGGYPTAWVDKDFGKAAPKFELLVAQDLFANAATDAATVVLPSCVWAERSGSFVNADGVIQPFEQAVNPPEGAMRDSQYLYEIAGFSGLFSAAKVRQMMAASIEAFKNVYIPPEMPKHQH